MNVVHPGVRGPPAHLLDNSRLDSIEDHGHSSSSAEGVGANKGRSDALGMESQGDHSSLHCVADVSGCDLPRTGIPSNVVGAEGCGGTAGVGHDVGYPAGKGLDWAGPDTCAVMVDALSFETILLVCDGKGGMGCQQQLRERSCVRNDSLVSSSEQHILDTELLCSTTLGTWCVGIFSHP